jgi:acyl-CoA synthetase (AMP-forming)/AMP-acid ligase II
MSGAASIGEIVRGWADRDPSRVCLTVHAGDAEVERLTYADLARRAAVHAALFRSRDLAPGDPVLLVARSEAGFIASFLGAQQAGLLAVPCPPPEPLESARRVSDRLREITTRCKARVLFDPGAVAMDAAVGAALAEVGTAVLGPSDVDASVEDARVDRIALSYCQFTSGSGGRAKGVLLTHENLVANIEAMRECYGLADGDRLATWLPLFHDMGLVSYVLMPLTLGLPIHIMSTLAFIARPVSWLALMSRTRATMSGAPNFAYALCARTATDEEVAALDLSRWRVAGNGAEPVTRAGVNAFLRRFAPCGFQPGAMLPAYGLAEDTLCATSRRPGQGPRFDEIARDALEAEDTARPEAGGVAIASIGAALPGHEISVVDGEGRAVGDRRIGELVIRGTSVMHGYLPGTEGEVGLSADRALSTGDLGYRVDGEFFLVGRKKDLIIRAGRNHYPQDIEDALLGIPGLRVGRAVAFSAPGAEAERIVVAAERAEEGIDEAPIRARIREAMIAAVGIGPDAVVLLPRNALPLTSSGKVMRPLARRLFLDGRWDAA